MSQSLAFVLVHLAPFRGAPQGFGRFPGLKPRAKSSSPWGGSTSGICMFPVEINDIRYVRFITRKSCALSGRIPIYKTSAYLSS